MTTNTSSLLALVLLFTASTLHADPLKSVNDPRMAWFKDAKFGLMIHWGVYALPAGYWSKDKSFDSWHHADESGLEQISGYAEQVMKNAQMRPEEYNKIAEVFDWSKWNAQDIIDLCHATGQRYPWRRGVALWPLSRNRTKAGGT